MLFTFGFPYDKRQILKEIIEMKKCGELGFSLRFPYRLAVLLSNHGLKVDHQRQSFYIFWFYILNIFHYKYGNKFKEEHCSN